MLRRRTRGREARSIRSVAAGAAVALGVTAVVALPAPAGAAEPPVVEGLTVEAVATGEPVPIVAEVTGADTVVADVVVDFADPLSVALADDGAGADAVAGDGIWTATIPGQPAGTLVRARVTATSSGGTTPFPDTDPDADDEAHHVGAVIDRPAVDTDLPLIDWYIAPDDYEVLMTDLPSKDYRPAVLVVGGVVYDGVRVRLQGGDLTRLPPKKNLRFKMADDHDLVLPSVSERPLEEFLLDAENDDPLGLRNELAWQVVTAAGGPGVAHHKVRVERNGTFEGLYTFIEEYDDEWLDARGAPDGLLYESDDQAFLWDVGPDRLGEAWDQKEPEDEPHDALADLSAAVDGPPGRRSSADLLDRVDVATLVNYYAVNALTRNVDNLNHNIWLFHDPGTERWDVLHWDLDLTFGRPAEVETDLPLAASIPHLAAAVARDPRLTDMVMARMRTIADAVLAPTGLPAWLDATLAETEPERALDRDRWQMGGDPAAIEAQLRTWFADQRAVVDGPWSADGLVPPVLAPGDEVEVTQVRGGGHPDGDVVALHNPADVAVDLSGWSLTGAVTADLPAGAVIPADETILVPASAHPDDLAESDVLVIGELDGPVPASGTVVLRDLAGAPTVQRSWSGGEVGGPPPAPDGLTVDTWIDGPAVPAGADLHLDIEVANESTAPMTGVTVAGPTATCDRTYPTLPAGARRVHRCLVPTGDPTGDTLRLGHQVIAVDAEADGIAPVRARRRIAITIVSGPPFEFPFRHPQVTGIDVAMVDGADLDVGWTPVDDDARRGYHVTQVEQGHAVPVRGTSAPADATGARVPSVEGTPVRVSVVPELLVDAATSAVAPAVTPRASSTWPSADADAWIRRTLSFVLGRAPTGAEVASWTAAHDAGAPPAALIAFTLAGSDSARREARVARLYSAFFGRRADLAGLRYWADRLAAGASISVVAESFARSPEFRDRFGDGTHAEFVELVYRNVLGRAPDQAGLAYWTDRIEAGRTRGWVMAAFSESPEGVARLAPGADVVVASAALLGSTPSRATYDEAIAWRRAGGTAGTVLESLRSSDAFGSRPPIG